MSRILLQILSAHIAKKRHSSKQKNSPNGRETIWAISELAGDVGPPALRDSLQIVLMTTLKSVSKLFATRCPILYRRPTMPSIQISDKKKPPCFWGQGGLD